MGGHKKQGVGGKCKLAGPLANANGPKLQLQRVLSGIVPPFHHNAHDTPEKPGRWDCFSKERHALEMVGVHGNFWLRLCQPFRRYSATAQPASPCLICGLF